jgi:starch synthase (maltosyl-transferring)
LWTVTIEGWCDSFALWLHDATIKVEVNDDIANALDEGSRILTAWATDDDAGLGARAKKTLLKAADTLADITLDISERFAAANTAEIQRLHQSNPLRSDISPSRPKAILVQRPKSSFASWYQFFPRSEGAYLDPQTHHIVQGTFATATSGLNRAKAEGFDIVYLPPIFPIGQTNRKGRNNALIAGPYDPGSPFGIGSALGGHDTVDPLLGTMDDFRDFCDTAHKLGLEIALDFALQCSPDHPWVKEHPNWFRHKADGSIAFAENPPKKYQDIYPIDFDEDMPGIEREVIRILELWIGAGVTAFRIDNPHTKPVRFWQDVIKAINKRHPEILFLAEAFTRPGMMLALSYVGFTQSHCYFPWAEHQRGTGGVSDLNQRRYGLLPTQFLLAYDPRYPHRLSARQRNSRSRGTCGAGFDGLGELGNLQRIRADRKQTAPGIRRTDRQRKVRNQAS